MDVQWWQWVVFSVAVLGMVALDLRSPRSSATLRSALVRSAVWLLVAIAFAGVVWAWAGPVPAGEYLSGYLVERTLSIDNVFVLAVVLRSFGLPAGTARRTLTWGIALALALRVVMIAAGASLLAAAHWVEYVFAAFLLATGVRIAWHRSAGGEAHQGGRTVSAAIRAVAGRGLAPAAVAMVAVGLTDLVFALDSIPSIFAITRDPFLVIAANALALAGLRSLYDLLAGSMDRFVHLNIGLGVVLVLIGLKMAGSDFYEPPILLTLALLAAVVGTSIATSLATTRPREGTQPCL